MKNITDFIKSEKGGWAMSILLILGLLVLAALPGGHTEETAAEEEENGAELIEAEAAPAAEMLDDTAVTEEEDAAAQPPLVWMRPLPGGMSRGTGYGYDQTYGDYRYHHGVDITGEPGSAVAAAAAGTVSAARPDSQWGGIVTVEHNGGWQTVYRCVEPAVASGATVRAGDALGYVLESSPAEYGAEPHVHFEMYLDGEEADPAEHI
ncbi:MAG: M23 family metallopeptidase [Firmicutes bacterium]|nr:M23 family metallopeptidase [Bacillota bacterium]